MTDSGVISGRGDCCGCVLCPQRACRVAVVARSPPSPLSQYKNILPAQWNESEVFVAAELGAQVVETDTRLSGRFKRGLVSAFLSSWTKAAIFTPLDSIKTRFQTLGRAETNVNNPTTVRTIAAQVYGRGALRCDGSMGCWPACGSCGEWAGVDMWVLLCDAVLCCGNTAFCGGKGALTFAPGPLSASRQSQWRLSQNQAS